jgi:putative FmdB family regulatory protein
MPIYEYQCASCGHRFERIHQKFSDPPVASCPACGGEVHKLISSPAIQFKGSGFYITDYAKKSGTDAGKEGKGSPTSSSSGGDSSSSSSNTPATPAASSTPAKKDA